MDHFLEMKKTVGSDDIERLSFFYIICNVDGLFSRKDSIYDFADRSIKPECLEEIAFSSSEKSLIEFAFNLFNNFPVHDSPLDLFGKLDDRNFEICLQALKIRFRK